MIRQFMVLVTILALLALTKPSPTAAQPINPEVHRQAFEKAKKDAEAVANVRVLSAVCTGVSEEGKAKTVTLNLALQILEVHKGALKKNDVVVVAHKVTLPTGPGPGSYGYMGAVRRFPFTPGVRGDVALRWDKDQRGYVPVAGWVAQPNGAAVPNEEGQAFSAGDSVKTKK
jgi:hypothetical protein